MKQIALIRTVLTLLAVIGSSAAFSQNSAVTLSGLVRDKADQSALPFVNVVLKTAVDSVFVTGTITDESGRFSIAAVKPGNYLLEIAFSGYTTFQQALYVGSSTPFLDLAAFELSEAGATDLKEVVIIARQSEVSEKMDKKVFSVENNISQSGGSVLQAMQNLPGVTVQDNKVQLRGNDKITILIDGKQTALTGFGDQYGLDNIPASAIERIEIINNPSSKYDANGNGGIINIIMKKSRQEGFSGKAGMSGGLGALWIKKANLPTIRPQYQYTPKFNPSLSLSYRKNKVNLFFQGDYLYTETLNKNEFVTRTYDDGTVINQQTKRNRNTHFITSKIGLDYAFNEHNTLTVSGLFGSEKILDHGDEPFFNGQGDRLRLWQFLEDELKITVMGTAAYQHKFAQAGHVLNAGFNYTFHRENEQYFFDNILPSYTGHDAFKLLSDEQVADLNVDYIKPLKYGRLETGLKFRYRGIPTNMQFFPGVNSPLDTNAGGWATYREIIPAVYGNYIIDREKVEAEIGLRVEYVDLKYDVNPGHNTYKSDGYSYMQPFPTMRLAYKFDNRNKLSLFYNRRVDRPNEVDIRIFPKYDDAEIIKVGNPALRPQFTNSMELGYKTSWRKGSFYTALYNRMANGTITRISSTVAGSNLIYAVFQNAGKSSNTGIEAIFTQDVRSWYSLNLNMNAYYNEIAAFTVENKYPVTHTFSAERQSIYSGNAKLNNTFHFAKNVDVQLTAIYLAPDIIPQGKIGARFSLDAGVKKKIQKGKGEVFVNATDLLNTMVIKREVRGNGFSYVSRDYYETQVIRFGYSYKF